MDPYSGLINNAALLLSLTILHHLLIASSRIDLTRTQIFAGLIFGITAVIGMSLPVHLLPGVFFDGRSVVLSIGALFGGPLVALISAAIAAIYRVWLGGAGGYVDVVAILCSTMVGMVGHYYLKQNRWVPGPLSLLVFGFMVHALAFSCMYFLAENIRDIVFQSITIPYFLVLPLTTSIFGSMILLIENRVKIEKNLKESEQNYRLLVDNLPQMVFTKDKNSRYISGNENFLNEIGLNAQELQGKSDNDLYPEEFAIKFRELEQKVIATKLPQESEHKYVGKNEAAWVNTVKVPLIDEKGNFNGILGVFTDVTEKKRTREELKHYRYRLEELVLKRTEELEIMRFQAEAANKAKSEFLANMGHEIRTPLHTILGLSHLLQRSDTSKSGIEQLHKIDIAGRHLLAIITDILDLSKIEAGKLELTNSDFELGHILEYTELMIANSAMSKGLKILVDPVDFSTTLYGDKIRIRQALLNYASNAVKFTETGSVSIRAIVLDDRNDSVLIRFEVEDTGIGINVKQHGQLFRAFEQIDSSKSRALGGSGLGLAITRNLAKLMGGDVGFDSAPGKGSTFWFTAIIRRSEKPAAKGSAKVLMLKSEYKLRADHAGAKILIAEDNSIVQELFRVILSHASLDVDTANNGLEALHKAKENDYDLVLMDLQMPKMDGLQAARKIRTLPKWQHKPIIAITANAFNEDRNACSHAGMNDFIAKPVDAEELYAMVYKWLNQSKKQFPQETNA